MKKRKLQKLILILVIITIMKVILIKPVSSLDRRLKIGGINLQFARYRIFSKYLSVFIKFYRKYRIYKLFDWLRYLDNANKYLRSKF